MRPRLRLLAGLVALALVAAAAPAAERRPLSGEEARALRAVGRLNIAGSRFCTATLIEPAVVLTAAHCLFDPKTGARVPRAALRFAAGWRQGKAAAVRPVTAVAIDPDFRFGRAANLSGVGSDLALLALSAPIPAVPPLTARRPARGRPFAIVSYAHDRPQAPSIEAPCRVIARLGGATALDCPVGAGVSGAPLIQGAAPNLRVSGVVSAMGRLLDGREVSLAVMNGPKLDRLRATLGP